MMRNAFSAANAIEAHMIADLLGGAGIYARVDGAFLQGGIGEIQANDLVRVMVEEDNYAEARAIVEEWDARSPSPDETPQPVSNAQAISSGWWLLIGFLLGCGFTAYLSSFVYSVRL